MSVWKLARDFGDIFGTFGIISNSSSLSTLVLLYSGKFALARAPVRGRVEVPFLNPDSKNDLDSTASSSSSAKRSILPGENF